MQQLKLHLEILRSAWQSEQFEIAGSVGPEASDVAHEQTSFQLRFQPEEPSESAEVDK